MQVTIQGSDFVRTSGWWAFFATVAAVGFGLWGVKESRRADHWQAEYAKESRAADEWMGAYRGLHHKWGEAETFYRNARRKCP